MSKTEVLIIILLIFIISLAIVGSIKRHSYLTEHCTVIGKVSGSTGFSVSSGQNGGVGTVYMPGKTGYKCDDGLEYWE